MDLFPFLLLLIFLVQGLCLEGANQVHFLFHIQYHLYSIHGAISIFDSKNPSTRYVYVQRELVRYSYYFIFQYHLYSIDGVLSIFASIHLSCTTPLFRGSQSGTVTIPYLIPFIINRWSSLHFCFHSSFLYKYSVQRELVRYSYYSISSTICSQQIEFFPFLLPPLFLLKVLC